MSEDRVYLDYNSTCPLVGPCKNSMIETLSVFGNASSVHFDGRRVRALIEKSREQIACAVNTEPDNIFFTSGASEAAAQLLRDQNCICAEVEHSCVKAWCDTSLEVSTNGQIKVGDLNRSCVQLANSETGILQELQCGIYMSDIVQAVGKIDVSFKSLKVRSAIISAHKFGGPQGIGAVLTEPNFELNPQITGGGQEKGYRSGTENLIAIVGFGAAMKFAKKQLDDGVWEKTKELRDFLEDEVANTSSNTIFIGKDERRLPNTSYFVTPGWPGQMQVMQMDLAGFSVSAGSACSSGVTSTNTGLTAIGLSPELAECGLRISIGSSTTRNQIRSFVKEWSRALSFKSKKSEYV